MARDSRRQAWIEEVGQRLGEELDRLGIKRQDAAKQLGVSKQRVSHWCTGKSEIQPFDLVRLRPLGVDIGFVITGARVGPSAPIQLVLPEMTFIPKLTLSQILQFSQRNLDISKLPKAVATYSRHSAQAFAFDVFDSGMLPNSKPGSTVIGIDSERAPEDGECVLVALLASSELLFRRYRSGPGGKPGMPPYTLEADNADWPNPKRQVRAADKPVTVGTKFEHIHIGST